MFDGFYWKTYNTKNSELPSNKVLSISVDYFNNKWIGTSSGLVIYKGGNFKILNTKNSKLPSNKIREIIIVEGSSYIATEKGVLIISVEDTVVINKYTQNIPDENIISIEVDDDKNIWIGTNSGLIKFKKDRFKFYNN